MGTLPAVWELSATEFEAKHRLAETFTRELQSAFGSKDASLTYDGNAIMSGDEEGQSSGHVYWLEFDLPGASIRAEIDDRLGDVRCQAAAKLREIAAKLERLAEAV